MHVIGQYNNKILKIHCQYATTQGRSFDNISKPFPFSRVAFNELHKQPIVNLGNDKTQTNNLFQLQ